VEWLKPPKSVELLFPEPNSYFRTESRFQAWGASAAAATASLKSVRCLHIPSTFDLLATNPADCKLRRYDVQLRANSAISPGIAVRHLFRMSVAGARMKLRPVRDAIHGAGSRVFIEFTLRITNDTRG
jgi:hypothetical protein